MKFVHVSDLHFHRSDSKNNKVEEMLRIIDEKLPEHNLIVTGDITDDGDKKQYKNAFNALKAFEGRIFICPGNHDYGAAGNLFTKKRAKDFDKYLMQPLNQTGSFYKDNEPVVNVVKSDVSNVMLIALDSNLETSIPFDFACGEIGDKQLNALQSILNSPDTDAMKKILFFHHHPFIHCDPFMQLKDREKLMRTIYGRVDVMLFGHKHKSEYWENAGGIKHVLASENLPGKNNAVREIVFSAQGIDVNSIQL